jgi:hypothetical protein
MCAILEQVPRFCAAGLPDGLIDVKILQAGGSFSRQNEVLVVINIKPRHKPLIV